MNDEERLLEVPSEDDDNTGDLPSKRVRRKKTKEERSADRKIVFWTLLFVLGMTFIFWLWPKTKNYRFWPPAFKVGVPKTEMPKSEWKNYVEYKL